MAFKIDKIRLILFRFVHSVKPGVMTPQIFLEVTSRVYEAIYSFKTFDLSKIKYISIFIINNVLVD